MIPYDKLSESEKKDLLKASLDKVAANQKPGNMGFLVFKSYSESLESALAGQVEHAKALYAQLQEAQRVARVLAEKLVILDSDNARLHIPEVNTALNFP